MYNEYNYITETLKTTTNMIGGLESTYEKRKKKLIAQRFRM